MPKRLTVAGSINTFTGYGLHAIQIVRDLERITGAFVSIRPLSRAESFGSKIPLDIASKFVSQPQPEDWELLIHPPNFMPTPGKRTAYFSMWEATKLPPRAVQLLNSAELIVVPCDWNASTFSACGVTVPIHKVPLGINTDLFHYRAKTPAESPLCVFGAAGRLAHGGVRKGINEVIDWFLAAFPTETDVELRVKAFPDCDIAKVTDPRIKVIKAHLSDEAMAKWVGDLTCFVSAAKGEGWGLIQHQSQACGVPVISVDFGGVKEFFNGRVGYPADYTLVPAQFLYTGCGHWAQPDMGHAIELMRRVYHQRWEAYEKGVLAHESVQHLTWDNSNRQLATVLQKAGAL